MIAEARFLRAHYYFLLVEFWGPVHLTFKETTGLETEATRTPEKTVYDSIISDLVYSVDNSPDVQPDFGRVTSWTAKHQLALVYLTRAYKTFARPDDFGKAADLAVEIIENSGHVLLDDYQEIYNLADEKGRLSHTNEQNKEIIFSVQYDIDPLLNGAGNRTHMFFRPHYEGYNRGLKRDLGHGYGISWMWFRPTAWMLENFRPLDVDSRFEKSFQIVWYFNRSWGLPAGASIGDTAIWITDRNLSGADIAEIKARLPGVNLLSWNINTIDQDWSLWRSDVSAVNDNISIWPSPWKMDDNLRAEVNEQKGSRDHIIFRLGETYLLAAEAMLGRDGNSSNALEYINTIRRRAAYPGKETEIEVSETDIDLDFILDEWARECFGEQSRWLDLKRTGKLLERAKKYNPDAKHNIKDHHVLRPIPANQIIRTTNDFGQNYGY
jgi:hypothetical protein